MAFKAIFQAFTGLDGEGGLKFIYVTANFRLFYSKKKYNKICWCPNLESFLYMAWKIILGYFINQ